MDLEMLVKDGLTAAREITDNNNNTNNSTPIIALQLMLPGQHRFNVSKQV